MSSEDEYSTNAQSFILKIDHPDQLIIAVNRSKDLDDTASPFPISPFSILVHNGSLEVVWMSSESNSYYLYICLQSFRLSVFSSFCLFGFLSFFLLWLVILVHISSSDFIRTRLEAFWILFNVFSYFCLFVWLFFRHVIVSCCLSSS